MEGVKNKSLPTPPKILLKQEVSYIMNSEVIKALYKIMVYKISQHNWPAADIPVAVTLMSISLSVVPSRSTHTFTLLGLDSNIE